MLSTTDKINAIDSFKTAYFKEVLKNIPIPEDGVPEKFEIDRWVLSDICSVLNDYQRELINHASDQ